MKRDLYHHVVFTGKNGRQVLVAAELVSLVQVDGGTTWIVCDGIHVGVIETLEDVIEKIRAANSLAAFEAFGQDKRAE